MIAWAAPKYSDLIYWTDKDLNAQPYVAGKTHTLRDEQAPGGVDPEQFFEERLRQAKARRSRRR